MRTCCLFVALALFAGPVEGALVTPAKPTVSASTTGGPRYVRRHGGGGVFSGSGQNWWRSRGTPPDNSTIPTPVNRHPKGRPYDPFPLFPKNM